MFANFPSRAALIWLWSIQAVLVLAALVVACMDAAYLSLVSSEEHNFLTTHFTISGHIDVAAAMLLAACAVSLVLAIAEISLFTLQRLTPTLNVASNTFGSALWLASFAASSVLFANSRSSTLAWVLSLFVVMATLAKLAHAAVSLHWQRHGRDDICLAVDSSKLDLMIQQTNTYSPSEAEFEAWRNSGKTKSTVNPFLRSHNSA